MFMLSPQFGSKTYFSVLALLSLLFLFNKCAKSTSQASTACAITTAIPLGTYYISDVKCGSESIFSSKAFTGSTDSSPSPSPSPSPSSSSSGFSISSIPKYLSLASFRSTCDEDNPYQTNVYVAQSTLDLLDIAVSAVDTQSITDIASPIIKLLRTTPLLDSNSYDLSSIEARNSSTLPEAIGLPNYNSGTINVSVSAKLTEAFVGSTEIMNSLDSALKPSTPSSGETVIQILIKPIIRILPRAAIIFNYTYTDPNVSLGFSDILDPICTSALKQKSGPLYLEFVKR